MYARFFTPLFAEEGGLHCWPRPASILPLRGGWIRYSAVVDRGWVCGSLAHTALCVDVVHSHPANHPHSPNWRVSFPCIPHAAALPCVDDSEQHTAVFEKPPS